MPPTLRKRPNFSEADKRAGKKGKRESKVGKVLGSVKEGDF